MLLLYCEDIMEIKKQIITLVLDVLFVITLIVVTFVYSKNMISKSKEVDRVLGQNGISRINR